jgi:hypothetical protein
MAGRPRGQSSSPGGGKNFLFSMPFRPALGFTRRVIQWVPGLERPGREADHSPPTTAEVKKTCVYTSTPLCAFRRSAYLVMYRDNLFFTFLTNYSRPSLYRVLGHNPQYDSMERPLLQFTGTEISQ